MDKYQERVIQEKKELDDKIIKLKVFKVFKGGEDFANLSLFDQVLLDEQLFHMQCYADVLVKDWKDGCHNV